MRSKRKSVLIATAVIAALATGGVAIAGAAGGGDDGADEAITGSALERASQAALQETGGGKVTETEAGDEEGAYEVEVTRADGTEVDVHLDSDFRVIGTEDEGPDDDD